MKNKQKQDFESVVGKLNAAYFFREFTFSTNTFKPNPASELELADKVVWLDDLMILSQIKERIAPPNTTADNERKWFTDEVVKKATRQMRDTLSYLKTYPKIKVRNNRRHVFNIASAQVTQTHRIVIYNPHPLLPPECATKKYHRSKTAGVLIDLIHALAYHAILRTLITPAEIAEYLAFRETLADKWGEALSKVGEKALVGQYIRNLPDQEPSAAFEAYVDAVNQKTEEWDIARLIHLFPARRTTPIKRRKQGYTVLQELAKLYRTDMAEFKKRFAFSMEKALADEASLPNRLTASTGCGFVFIPLQRKQLPHRKKLLVTFRYRQKWTQWMAWYEHSESEPHSIESQIHRMLFNDLTYRALVSVRASVDAALPISARSATLAYLLDHGYVASQVLALQNLLDPSKGVISVRRLLKDVEKHRELITREVYVA